ncbi:MAG: hypothetical protein V2A71_04485 [Candidatus Eisenbacteria bacterium]
MEPRTPPENFSTWMEYFFEHWDDLPGFVHLRSGPITEVEDRAYEEWKALLAQRDALLAALKAFVEPCECYERIRGNYGMLCQRARAAIAEAEGK